MSGQPTITPQEAAALRALIEEVLRRIDKVEAALDAYTVARFMESGP